MLTIKNKIIFRCWLYFIITIVSMPVFSHHSRQNFNLDVNIEIEGILTEFSWRNPHTFAKLLVTDGNGEDKEWLLELNSIQVLSRLGWNRDSLQEGQFVKVLGSPDRNPEKLFFYSQLFTLEDGTELASSPEAANPETLMNMMPRQQTSSTSAEDIFATWIATPMGGRGQVTGGFGGGRTGGGRPGGQPNFLTGAVFGPTTNLPVNAKGQEAIDNFNEMDNPEFSCIPPTAPTLLARENVKIELQDQTITFTHALMDAERIIHLNSDVDPATIEPTLHGYSIGTYENGILEFVTTRFSPNHWGNGRGIPSGDQKKVTERYSLINNGNAIQIEWTQEDPEFLSENISGTRILSFGGNNDWVEYNCDPEASNRHLER